MDLAPERLHRTAVDIVDELRREPAFGAELQRAQRQFFGGAPDYAPTNEARQAAAGRFAEWFVLERESEHLGATPLEAVGGLSERVRAVLRASVCGLFLVEASGDDVRVRDVITGDAFDLATDAQLAPGDVVVGRVYPAQLDAVTPSPVAAILRQGQDVVAALQRDLARAGLARRLTQAEIEAVLFRSAGELSTAQVRRVPPERLEARLDSLLRAGGDTNYSAADISAALAAATDGPGHVMGPLLEDLAFDTDVDLDAARTTMLELWNEHRLRAAQPAPAPGPEPTPPTGHAQRPPLPAGPGLGATIAARIEQGLAAHENIEALFADVEGMLGVEGSDEDDDNDNDGATVPEGDLDALRAEFLWERGYSPDSAHATVLDAFVEHQRQLPTPGVYLESIPARELVSFLLRTYLATPAATRTAAVSARFAVLREFYAWGVETQSYDLDAAIDECERVLIEELPRLQRASVALSRAAPAPASARPRVLRVTRIDAGEVEVVGDGTEPSWLDVPEAAADLRADDRILVAVTSDGRDGLRLVGLATVLPSGTADLLE
jgi:hypothetical protein